jgi:hypothetical protein
MNLKRLINKSVYGTIGYLQSYSDIELLSQYISYNYPILKEFKQIVVATNYGSPLQSENTLLWKTFFPDCIILDSEVNRGHNFGTADLDNLVFNWCKQNGEEWICKSSNDVLLKESILDIQIEQSDFYYLNGIGYGGMVKYDFDFQTIIEQDFYPQTNFYFLNVTKTDWLNNERFLDETFEYTHTIPNYNGKVWEYIEGWSCETFLKQCIERNNLLKYHLIPQEKYRILLQLVKENNIHDCSHKNIMVEGICHFQYSNQQVIEI